MTNNKLKYAEIELTDCGDYKVNTLVKINDEWFIIRSIVRVWYNPVKSKNIMVCGVKKFEGDFIDMPF